MNAQWKKHWTHQITLTKGKGPHAYELRCIQCDKSIQWLKAKDAMKIMPVLIKK